MTRHELHRCIEILADLIRQAERDGDWQRQIELARVAESLARELHGLALRQDAAA